MSASCEVEIIQVGKHSFYEIFQIKESSNICSGEMEIDLTQKELIVYISPSDYELFDHIYNPI